MPDTSSVVSATLYAAACFLLLPATTFLYFAATQQASIAMFISATSLLTMAAIVDIVAAWALTSGVTGTSEEMSPLVVENKALQRKKVPSSTWVVLVAYLAGGLLFLGGAILFFPLLPKEMALKGVWVFRFGSISYFFGSTFLLVLIWRAEKNHTLTLSLLIYNLGSVAFICGGILSELSYSGLVSTSVWMLGSISFFIGAFLGLVNVWKS